MFCALSLTALTISSCSNDDNTGDSSLIVAQGVNGTISLVAPLSATQTVSEVNENTYQFTVTLDKPQAVDVQVRFDATGTATLGDDYEVITNDPTGSNSYILIPANTTTATAKIKILNDDTVEGDENFTLKIGTISTTNATVNSNTVSFVIKNFVSNELDLTFAFSKAFSIAGTSYTLAGIGYDMDYYLLDSSYNDTGNYDAATGASPEHLVLDVSTLAAGTYYIFYDIYDDGGISSVYHDPFDIPTKVNYFRGGAISPGTFVQEDAFVPNSTDGSGYDYVITIEVAGGVATLKNSVPQVIASGKNASKIKESLAHARLNNNKKK